MGLVNPPPQQPASPKAAPLGPLPLSSSFVSGPSANPFAVLAQLDPEVTPDDFDFEDQDCQETPDLFPCVSASPSVSVSVPAVSSSVSDVSAVPSASSPACSVSASSSLPAVVSPFSLISTPTGPPIPFSSCTAPAIHSFSIYRKSQDLGHAKLLTIGALVNSEFPAHCMVDSGATSLFVDHSFLSKHNLVPTLKSSPESLFVVDGREHSAGKITHEILLEFALGAHVESVIFHVTKLADYDMILGKSWLNCHDPHISWPKNTLSFPAPRCIAHMATPQPPLSFVPATVSPAKVSAASVPLSPSEIKELESLVPPAYHEFLPLFSKSQADVLPPHRYIDHEIPLVDAAKPSFGPLYNMSDLELKALKEYLDENLAKGFIRPSSSSAASPVLFVKKKDETLRFCVDYRSLNALTKKNRYPLPLTNESLRHVSKGKIFTRLDLRSAYNLIRIKKGDEWKTAFRTRYGLFEYLVMPFGLTNAPASCQQFVNDVLREFLDVFVVCYMDDILIYSEDPLQHEAHVKLVLQKLLDAGLFVKGEKCEFHTKSTCFVGFMISPNDISMDPKKIETVLEWKAPRNVKEVQSFLGFANFYRRFIKDYSRIARPLFNLLKKDLKFNWTPAQDTAFSKLKTAFTSAPILRHFDPLLDTILECDASDLVISGILSQYFIGPDGKKMLHPIAYFSRKMTAPEVNYGIGDKELLAIVASVREFYPMIVSLSSPVSIITDHLNLASITSRTIGNRRQARWALELAEIDYRITYRPGTANTRADALTRRSTDLTAPATAPQPILEPSKIVLSALHTSLVSQIASALENDELAQSIVKALRTHAPRHPTVDLAACSLDSDNLLLVNGLVYVPSDPDLRLDLIKSRHGHPAAGHPGRAATFELLTRDFWWPGMRSDLARFIRNCDTCQRSKPARHSPYGFLKPLSVPQSRWESISLDFVTGLPSSLDFDSVLVVVDRLSKMAHFVPCTSSLDALSFATLFRDNIFKLHGLPKDITSDRDSLFTSDFIKALAQALHVSQHLSTAFHPQTDGQTERVNAILEQYLRAYCNYQQDNWADLLAFAEFAYNNTVSATTRVTPFFANYGYHPRFEVSSIDPPASDPLLVDYAATLKDLEAFLRAEMTWAQASMADQANKHLSAPPVFKEGDLVWLLRKNIRTQRPSSKLDSKKLGPFPVSKKISSHAYRLALPPSMRIHPVFHVSLLEPHATDPLPGQSNPPPPPVIVGGNEEWWVEEILDVRARGPLRYLVKWVDDPQPTWESYRNVKDLSALDEFYAKYPDKRRPPIEETSLERGG